MINKTYIQELRKLSNKTVINNKKIVKNSENLISLADQIAKMINELPPRLVNRPWSMSEFVSRLDGKYKKRPHAQNVATELKKLNWTKMRLWKHGYNGARIWLPPSVNDDNY